MPGSLPSATVGKLQVLCRPPRTAKSLPSATVGKLTKWVSSQEAQLAATWLLWRLRQTAKSSLPSVADGKEPAYCLFFLFFVKSHNLHRKYIWHIDIFHRHSSHKQVHTSFDTQTRSIHHFIHKQVPSIISYIKKFHPYIKKHSIAKVTRMRRQEWEDKKKKSRTSTPSST